VAEPERLDARDAAIKRSETTLIASASRWMQEALAGWVDDDHGKVSVHAPHAVELLGKAALWRESPTLLLPLANGAEASLFILAQKPDLAATGLRTIGLATVLARLEKLLGALPLNPKQRSRMADTRNGALHVGTQDQTRHVLTDAITVCSLLLPRIDQTARAFYGPHVDLAEGLVQERRTAVEHRVATKRARAQKVFGNLESSLEENEFEEVTTSRQASAEDDLVPSNFFAEHALDQDCPVCAFTGRLFGDVDVDHELEYEQMPDGDIVPILASDYFSISFIPKAFACNVCKLELADREELQAGGLETDPQDVQGYQLGYNFDPADYIDERYAEVV